jgi:hypothetical protein
MAAKVTLTFDKTWKKLIHKLSVAKFTVALKEQVARATELNAMLVDAEVRRAIKNKKTGGPANAALTVLIKKSKKPLVDSGQLFKSVTYKMLTEFTAEVGVLKGDASANIAVAVHEGATIKVTARMRAMFAMLAAASGARGKRRAAIVSKLTGRAEELWKRRKNGWKALKPSTTHIRIPPRPFIRVVIEDPRIRRRAFKNWQKAIKAAFEDDKI